MAVLLPNSPSSPLQRACLRRRALLAPLHLWHLLSLDAPTVAALWAFFIARSVHLRLAFTTPLSMFLAVWLLYGADRLLDANPLLSNPLHQHLEDRHRFHHLHRTGFLTGIALASSALALLLPRIPAEALHLYLVVGTLLVGYFVVIHATPSAPRLPKELAVGLFFSAATFIPTISRLPALRLPLLGSALLFAILCSLNCLFIYAWEHPHPEHAYPEHPHPERSAEAHPATLQALRHLQPLAFASLLLGLALAFIPALLLNAPPNPLAAAAALSIAALLLLHRNQQSFSRLTLRAAADLALLTPILFLFRA